MEGRLHLRFKGLIFDWVFMVCCDVSWWFSRKPNTRGQTRGIGTRKVSVMIIIIMTTINDNSISSFITIIDHHSHYYYYV